MTDRDFNQALNSLKSPLIVTIEEESSDFDSRSYQDSESSDGEEEVLQRVVSNLFFLVGSSAIFITSIIDVHSLNNSYYYYYDDDDYQGIHPMSRALKSLQNHLKLDTYTILSVLGSFFCLLNSCVDIYWEIRWIKEGYNTYFLQWDLFAASAFGIAATLDLGSYFYSQFDYYYYYYENERYITTNVISPHFYLLSAIFSQVNVVGYQSSPSGSLNYIGNILFMVGSLIDTVIGYISDPDIVKENEKVLVYFDLLSSSLWLTNAVLSIVADIIYFCFNNKVPCCTFSQPSGRNDDQINSTEKDDLSSPSQSDTLIS